MKASGNGPPGKFRLTLAENVELEAIRALQYEGTPLENAQNFKEQGNEMVKLRRWKDGQEFYTNAIDLLRQAEGREERELQTICYVNRALCNLELSEL